MKISQKLLLILAMYICGVASVSLRQDPYGGRDTDDIDEIVEDLKVAKTHVDRIKILAKDSQFVFDFIAAAKVSTVVGEGGVLASANAGTFPAVVGNSIAMTLGFIEGCGLNTPHVHPRSAEFFLAVNGTFATGFIAENGARTVLNTLKPGQATVFPQGSIHWQANLGCEKVLFVGGFSHEDPGALQIAQNFFGISADVVSATLGGLDPKKIEEIKEYIPANVALGLQQCLIRCRLKRDRYEGYSADESYSGGDSYDDNDDYDDDDDTGSGYPEA